MAKKLMNVRLNDELQKRLNEASEKTGLTKTKIIETALKAQFDKYARLENVINNFEKQEAN